MVIALLTKKPLCESLSFYTVNYYYYYRLTTQYSLTMYKHQLLNKRLIKHFIIC